MANKLQIKRTSVSGRTPNTTNSGNTHFIDTGEFALNLADGILYSSNGSGVIEIGSNTTTQRITNALIVSNDKRIHFNTVNTAVSAHFVQQSDDNFVFYTTNTAYGQRPVWSIFANSITSAFSISTPTIFNGNIDLGQVSVTANGTTGTAGQVLASNGSATYWVSPGAASVNTSAQFSWTNTHTFSANVSFTGNGIGIASNTGAIYLGGISDANWRIGRNTGAVTKWIYTNNTIDIVTANSNLEGVSIGLVGGNSYFETGYLGTYISSNVTVGNTSINATINSTAFSGTANNSTNLGGIGAASYVQNTDSRTLSGNLVISGTYFNPSSNTILLGNTSQRWVLSANTGDFSSNVTSNTVSLRGSSGSFTATINPTTLTADQTVTIPDESFTIGFRNIPPVGTKTSSYTLATADVGKYVQVGSGGSIVIPDATFAEGDAINIFNNTSGSITITCSITTAYIAGTDTDVASVTLATRGMATILFISSTVCVIAGNIT